MVSVRSVTVLVWSNHLARKVFGPELGRLNRSFFFSTFFVPCRQDPHLALEKPLLLPSTACRTLTPAHWKPDPLRSYWKSPSSPSPASRTPPFPQSHPPTPFCKNPTPVQDPPPLQSHPSIPRTRNPPPSLRRENS